MQLQPYLYFDGTCAAAVAFYESIFGGTVDISRVGDTPAAAHVPSEQHSRVIHAVFVAPGVAFMASDGPPGTSYTGGNVSMAIGTEEVAEGERVFRALGDGGVVTMAFAQQFWGAHFGTLTDRYGIAWMVNAG